MKHTTVVWGEIALLRAKAETYRKSYGLDRWEEISGPFHPVEGTLYITDDPTKAAPAKPISFSLRTVTREVAEEMVKVHKELGMGDDLE